MSQQNYNEYTTEDLLNDPDFIAAVKYRDQQKIDFWDKLTSEKVIDAAAFADAVLQLQVILCASPAVPPTGFIDQLEQDILQTIREQRKIRIIKLKRRVAALAVAASILVGVAAGWFYMSTITITTGYAQTLKVSLLDGTQITLNANSSISYPRALAYGRKRQVQLSGEAFFDVVHINQDTTHIKPSEIFTVDTRNVHVEVLGTKFNVKERRGITSVYLVKGKVRVSGRVLKQVLIPNELLSANSVSYHKITIAPAQQVSWLSHKMLVHNTSLKEVVENFEDVFGKKIIFKNQTLYSKAIDGTIAMDNEQNTLFILSAITNCKVVKQGDQIYFIPSN